MTSNLIIFWGVIMWLGLQIPAGILLGTVFRRMGECDEAEHPDFVCPPDCPAIAPAIATDERDWIWA